MKQCRRLIKISMKRFLSITLAFMMILGAMPIENLIVFAADGDPVVNGVLVTKTYTGPNQLKVMYIEVSGDNLDKLGNNPVIVRDEWGEPKALTSIVENQYKLYYKIEDPKGVSRVSVKGKDYNIGADNMPTITSIEPVNRMVSNKEILTINGNGFLKADVKINFYNRSGSLDNYKVTSSADNIIKEFLPNTPGGPYRVEFKYTDTANNLTIEDNYVDLFTVYGELNVSDDITMVPNQGPVDTLVRIKGEELTGDMSVFFLKNIDGSDSYRVDNRGIKESYKEDAEKDGSGQDTIDVYTVKVPSKLEQGRYYVILTNNVNDENNLEGRITSTKMFENNVFTVVNNDDTLSVVDVTPSRGPETGTDSEIQGRYIGTLSPNVFTSNENSAFKVADIIPSSNILKVSYEPKESGKSIGKYKLIGGEDGVDVTKIEREITVFVGGRATFRHNSTFTDSVDKINIRVPSINLQDGEDPAKAVTVDVKTTIEYEGGDKPLIIVETGTWKKGKFIFEPISYKPKVTTIIPDKIPVDTDNEIVESFKISIIGENFLKYRYKDKDGNVKVKYPVIDLGGQVTLNPNIAVTDIKMFNKNGIEIDGTPGNDLATKILITVPKGVLVDPNIIGQISRLKVTNPIKNEEEITAAEPDKHMGLSDDGEIRFVKITPDKIPTITAVLPSTVTTDGEKGVKILGQNFRDNISVYLDGEKVTGIKRNGTGTEITFDAPKKPEGKYQIIIQNEEGDLAVYDDFLYVKTYTNPKIIDFNPKKGTVKTLVTVKGENFVPPNPLVKDIQDMGIWKLVGTRVLLGDKDVNEYYLPDDKKAPGLQSYTSPSGKPLVANDKGNLVLSDYYHSVILQEGEIDKTYYKIYFDTKTGEIKLTDGDKNVYIIGIKGSGYTAVKDGKEYPIVVNTTNLTIDLGSGTEKKLDFKTPYTVEDGLIVGNRVKVINNNELVFEVPPMPREGYYDVTVVNPDTKKDSKVGNNGFYYAFQPEYNPIVTEIKPSEGSIEGGYYINITGDRFKNNGGDDKTSVTIGSVKVDPKDINVSLDGKSLRVKVPKYPGDLEKETDMDRKSVVVVVANPDGGTASIENGFTYIIPISNPRITNLILNKGTAAGGESIIIEGSGFRFYEPYKDLDNNLGWDEGEPFNNLNDNKDKDGNPIWDDLRYWLSPDLKQKYDELAKNYDKNIIPILPKVYFGGEEVVVKDFTSTTIEVETPKGVKGPVEVYLVNNDYGTSNKVNFTYESSNPNIKTIVPNVGKKQGNDKVEILGENFHESKVRVIKSINEIEDQTLQIVQFGNSKDTNISNRDISIDAPQNSGRIRDRQSTVKVGNLTVKYDATSDDRKLDFTVEEGTGDHKAIYKLENVGYDDSEIFFPVSLLKDNNNNPYNGYEYVRIRLEKVPGANVTTRLRVDRGFSPESRLKGQGHITLKTPSYYTVGKVPVIVINPDGGQTEGQFEYKNPDSKPSITNVLRDGQEGIQDNGRKIVKVNIKGGNIITVLGKDFRKPVKIKIGDLPEIIQGIEYDPSNEPISRRITFKMPVIGENYVNSVHRLVIENEDGGVAGSDDANPPIYIQFIKGETDGLAITDVNPKFGPATGGTVVTIEGKDFRSTMDGYPNEKLKVYFGNGQNQVKVQDEDIISIEINRIQLRTPANAPGSVTVKVENPDGSIAELNNGFTYLSSPKITAVVDPIDPTERSPISVISILGGQKIKLKGAGFMEGAKVYFSPKVTPAKESELNNAGIIYIEGKPYLLDEGTEGTEYKWISNETVTIKTPPQKTDSFGVIVVNPDKGATPIFTNITYGLPEVAAPSGVVAELVYDRFIRVHWNAVTGATEYEIFVVIDDKNVQLIGSTELTSFVYNDLEPKTRYRFIVKAVGDFGSSKPSMESNTVRTGSTVGSPDEDGGLVEDTIMSKTGNTANVTIGSKDRSMGDVVIDLTKGTLAGSNEVVISLPASVILDSGNRNIKVIGKDFVLQLQPSAFNVANVRENKDKANTGVRFVITPDSGNTQVQSGNQISTAYKLEASTYVGIVSTPMDYLAKEIDFVLDYDVDKANLRKLNKANFNYFNSVDNTWQAVGGAISMIDGMISGKISRLGRYTIIGSRG